MLGLRDLFIVAPPSSFHSHEPIISDPHSIAGSNLATALGVGVGVFPLLAQSNVTGAEDQSIGYLSRGGGIQQWQNQQPNHETYLKKAAIDHHSTENTVYGGSIGPAPTCQDCGNQAKKDCSHRRCRTSCKGRGFNCSTHIKSTWVPAARRRERQIIATGAVSSGSTSGTKKPRLITSQTTTNSHTSASNTTPPRSYETTSSYPADGGSKEALPGQVRAPAVFKCVRVTAVDDEEDEYAYQAVVRIGGHVFKGFLYDQGAESREGFPNISDLHLNGGADNGKNGASSSSHLLHPTLY